MPEQEPKIRKVILKSNKDLDPLDPRRFYIEDVDTREKLDNVKSIQLGISADEPPLLTVQQYPTDFDIEDIPFDAVFEPTNGYVDDAKKQRWINGRWLAELFRKYGTQCVKDGKPAIALDVSEDLLKEWEGPQTGPNGGQQNKENTSHGKH